MNFGNTTPQHSLTQNRPHIYKYSSTKLKTDRQTATAIKSNQTSLHSCVREVVNLELRVRASNC